MLKKVHLKRYFILTAALTLVLIFLQILPRKGGLLRGTFGKTWPLKEEKIKFNAFAMEKRDTFLSVITTPYTYKGGFSIEGAALVNKFSNDGPQQVDVTPHLKGKYIMDFHYFYFSLPGKKNRLLLEIKDKTKVKLKNVRDAARYQLPVELSKEDTITFSLKGKGFALISNPVFYKDNRESKKDLVFIISVDTLRCDHVGVYNKKKRCTPNIDRFSKDAVVFKRAYSSSSWTLPAHISLFTGRYAHAHHMNFRDNTRNNQITGTLFEELQKKFITVSFNGGIFLSHRFGFARGFDLYYEAKHDTGNAFAASLLFKNVKYYIDNDQFNVPLLFFLHTYQVHSRYHPEKKFAKRYFKNKPHKYESFEILDLTQKGKDQYNRAVSAREKEEIVKVYDAGIYTFDLRFGGLIKFLKKRGLYQHSTIVLLSDHGEEFRDHDGWEHGHTLYDELIHIPLLVKFPGNQYAGREINAAVSIVDILPTLWAMNDISSRDHKKIHGVSLFKALENKTGNRKIVSYLAPYACSRTPMKTAVISERFKCILNEKMTGEDLNYFISPPPVIPPFELYDLLKDPVEKKNLKDREKGQLGQMIKILKGLRYEKSQTQFPKELQKELRSLGYLE